MIGILAQRTRLLALAMGGFSCALLGLMACGGDKLPAQLPSTSARDRMATRVELVELVISDPQRAAKVRSLYTAMDSLLVETKLTQARQIALVASERPTSDEETRARLAAVRQAESSALERYIGLQLELRRFVTADEFARLDAIR